MLLTVDYGDDGRPSGITRADDEESTRDWLLAALVSGPRGVADDLKKLPGVSPAIEKQLNDLGLFHFSQIAELNDKAAHNVGEEVGLPGRVPGWVTKAKELTAE